MGCRVSYIVEERHPGSLHLDVFISNKLGRRLDSQTPKAKHKLLPYSSHVSTPKAKRHLILRHSILPRSLEKSRLWLQASELGRRLVVGDGISARDNLASCHARNDVDDL